MMRSQLTLTSTGFEKYTKVTRRAQFLAEMDRVVPWRDLCARIEPVSPQAGNGRPPVGLERMLRMYFLQQWFNLSDPAVEEALYDSPTMRAFVGIDLGRPSTRTSPSAPRRRRIRGSRIRSSSRGGRTTAWRASTTTGRGTTTQCCSGLSPKIRSGSAAGSTCTRMYEIVLPSTATRGGCDRETSPRALMPRVSLRRATRPVPRCRPATSGAVGSIRFRADGRTRRR